MQRSSTYKAEGVVLSRRELGDADRIITLYTREFGKRRLVARGARKPSSRLGPHLELFSQVRVLGVVGANLDILSQVEPLHTFTRVRADLHAFAAAGWAIELLDGLTEEGESAPDAYAALLAFLHGIEPATADVDTWLTALALTLLAAHGYRPELHVCTVCRSAVVPGRHRFAPTLGGVACAACAPGASARPLAVDTLKVLRYLAEEGFAGAARVRVGASVRAELREILQAYAGAVTERDLKSGALLGRTGGVARPRPSYEP
ncbi:MAG: DNA repair protein RecO [Actinobacteria bacterium]|nr:DNA repair protein RecO [Actinomycetota bacterium]